MGGETGNCTEEIALGVSQLSKSFGQTRALDHVSFSVKKGQVHGLLGGNGSGKSTLIKILAGVHRGEAGGRIDLLGTKVASDAVTPELAHRLGLRFVHQNPAVFASMTVAENMAIGNGFPTIAGRIDWRSLRARTQQMLDRFEISARADENLGDLRQAEQTMIAIARALQDADKDAVSALILDEPTASLPDHEVEVLLKAVRRFSGEHGHTILYVSHRLDEVLQITDSVTVLRDGCHIATRETDGMSEADIVKMIVGHALVKTFAPSEVDASSDRPGQTAGPVLDVKHLKGGPLADVSFSVAPGEVLGIAGLLGSGRTELLRIIFGDMPCKSGTVLLQGVPVDFAEPLKAMNAGVALVPENREREGVFQGLSVMDNLSVGQFRRFMRGFRISSSREKAEARRSIRDYVVKAENETALISTLSGGNQQKVVMGRWLRRKPRLLLLDEPTQGVDVGAREDLYASIRAAAMDGTAVVAVSSDFDELAQICNRVIVLKDGRVTDELVGAEITRQSMTELVLASQERAA